MTRKEAFDKVQELKNEGLTEVQIAKEFGISVEHLRQFRAEVRGSKIAETLDQVDKLKSEGYSNREIADIMGISENTVRQILPKEET